MTVCHRNDVLAGTVESALFSQQPTNKIHEIVLASHAVVLYPVVLSLNKCVSIYTPGSDLPAV